MTICVAVVSVADCGVGWGVGWVGGSGVSEGGLGDDVDVDVY